MTTPNQRSLLSLMTLITKGRFSAFQDSDYPAHITALLDIDLLRIGAELGLTNMAIEYTRYGRIPLTPWHYPTALRRCSPARCRITWCISRGNPCAMPRSLETGGWGQPVCAL